MDDYFIGADVIGAEASKYTDKATVLAVQTKLKELSVSDVRLDPKGADGVWGPDTANAVKALRKMGNQSESGGIDDYVLAALGVSRGGGGGSVSSVKIPAAIAQQAAAVVNPPTEPPSFLMRALWEGAPIKVWQGGLLGIGGLALIGGLAAALSSRR